jgi:hypothetical protein
MVNSLDVETTAKSRYVTSPFIKQSPYSGESDLTIRPEERQAVDALVSAYRQFAELIEQSGSSSNSLLREFTEGIHWAQLAIGTVRFYHTLNQEHRQRLLAADPISPQGLETMTSLNTLETIEEWRDDFQDHVMGRAYSDTHFAIADQLILAWDQILLLTELYPDQHVYDDFIRGINLCEDVLNRLRLESLVHA